MKISLRVTNSMDALLFSHFRVTNVKLLNEKNSSQYYSFQVCETVRIANTP